MVSQLSINKSENEQSHCEPVRTLAWQSPKDSGSLEEIATSAFGLLAMTCSFLTGQKLSHHKRCEKGLLQFLQQPFASDNYYCAA